MPALLGPLAFLPSMGEWIVLLVIGLLLFGKNLPQVLKDAGRQVAELKRTFERLKSQLHEDKEFRELSSAARDLKDAVTAPKRMFEDSVRNATSEFMREVDTVRTEVTGSVASPTDDLGGAPVRFEGLTNETKATPGPDAAFVSAPSGKSLFEQEAAKLGGA